MRVLVLGASGMLGHKVWQHCSTRFETWACVRSPRGLPEELGDSSRVLTGVHADRPDDLPAVFARVRPDAVINCIGLVKQIAGGDPVPSLTINALLPHRIARLCDLAGARLVHISTDCVFAGRKGLYSEDEVPDAGDLYGRSKALGEPAAAHVLTLRTSMIGRELSTSHGLLEWFLGQKGGRVSGYTHAIFSGPTSIELARVIGRVLADTPELSGVYHVSAEPIAKYDLLRRLNDAFRSGVRIDAEGDPHVDRSLDSSRFRQATGWQPPSWDSLVDELASDPTAYERWRTA